MNDRNDPLVSRQVSTRRAEKEKLKLHQQMEMTGRQINAPTNAFQQSCDATTDHYMTAALMKVRQSKTTLPDDLTRFHGSWVYSNK